MRGGQILISLLVSALAMAAPVAANDVPPCSFGDEIVDFNQDTDWNTVVVDSRLSLPHDYAPGDLVPLGSVARIAGGGRIRALVVDDLAAMATDARADGVRLAVQSAYRSFAGQASTFREWVRKIGLDHAKKTSARPGHSEHQLGTAIDFRMPGDVLPWKNIGRFESSPVGRWLKSNAWRYGFVLSYPKDKFETVCYDYEPWHYRYVGRELAQAIHESGEVPRVWLLTHPTPTPTAAPTPTPASTTSPTESPSPSPSAAPSDTPEPSPSTEPTDSPEPSPTAAPTTAPDPVN